VAGAHTQGKKLFLAATSFRQVVIFLNLWHSIKLPRTGVWKDIDTTTANNYHDKQTNTLPNRLPTTIHMKFCRACTLSHEEPRQHQPVGDVGMINRWHTQMNLNDGVHSCCILQQKCFEWQFLHFFRALEIAPAKWPLTAMLQITATLRGSTPGPPRRLLERDIQRHPSTFTRL